MKWNMALTWKSNLFYSKYLVNFCFDKMSKSIASHTPQWWEKFLPRPKDHVETLLHMLLVFVLSFVKLCFGPCWESYHAFKIKITYTPPNICTTPILGVVAKTCLPLRSIQKYSTPTLGVSKNMFIRFHQNKCSKSLLISLSKVLLQKEAWGYHQKKKERKKEKEKEKKRIKERWE